MESKSSTILQESIVIDKESKSIGIEAFALVETANEEQLITGVSSLLATEVYITIFASE